MKLNLNNQVALKCYLDWIAKTTKQSVVISSAEISLLTWNCSTQDKENVNILKDFFDKVDEYAKKYYIQPSTGTVDDIYIKEYFLVYKDVSFRVCEDTYNSRHYSIKPILSEIPSKVIIIFGEDIISDKTPSFGRFEKKIANFNEHKDLAKKQGFSDEEICNMFNFYLN